MHEITTTASINPLTDPVAFRAAVLAWLVVLSAVLLAARPVLLDIVELVWALRARWVALQTGAEAEPPKEPKP